MITIEGAIYCAPCVGRLPERTRMPLTLTFPASHDENEKGTCWGCGVTVLLCKASKVKRRKKNGI